jgi:hypothetical protein
MVFPYSPWDERTIRSDVAWLWELEELEVASRRLPPSTWHPIRCLIIGLISFFSTLFSEYQSKVKFLRSVPVWKHLHFPDYIAGYKTLMLIFISLKSFCREYPDFCQESMFFSFFSDRLSHFSLHLWRSIISCSQDMDF